MPNPKTGSDTMKDATARGDVKANKAVRGVDNMDDINYEAQLRSGMDAVAQHAFEERETQPKVKAP